MKPTGRSSAWARAAAFPVIAGGALVAAIAGLAFDLPATLVTVVITAVGTAFAIAAERAYPWAEAWRRSRGDRLTDALHLVFTNGAVGAAVFAISAAVARVSPRPWLASGAGFGWMAQLVPALLLGELGAYWFHRLTHRVGWLWRLHAIHHGALRLYWLNISRFHPLDGLGAALAAGLPLALLGFDERALAVLTVFGRVFGVLQHANVDFRLGRFAPLFSVADAHRWHHSRVRAESDANYGSVLLVWDHVFGTYRAPGRTPPVDVGIAGDPVPPGYLAQLLAPFRRRT